MSGLKESSRFEGGETSQRVDFCLWGMLQSSQHLYSTAAAKAVGIQGTPHVKTPTICWENISH